MGIQDRSYIDRRSSSGLSVTSWIMIVCAVVFALQWIFLQGARVGWPVYVQDKVLPGADITGIHVTGDYKDYFGGPTSKTRIEDPKNGPTIITKELINAKNEQVGLRLFEVRDVPTAFGHFSTYTGVLRLEVWRLITFQFLHGGILHLALNMLGLWSFARPVEEHLGPKRYLAFYLMCGIAGGLMYLLLNLAGFTIFATTGAQVPGLLVQHVSTPLIGASAGVFGVIMACAKLAPDEDASIFGLISLPMKHFAYGYVIISLIMLLAGARNAGGEAAHLGGAIAGFFFIRNSHLLRDFFDIFGRASDRMKAARGPKLKLVGEPQEPGAKRGATATPTDAKPAKAKPKLPADLQQAMDAALAKQLETGPNSLTLEEQEALRKATEWLNKDD
jgi:membrane associated rhomboid family serine protease